MTDYSKLFERTLYTTNQFQYLIGESIIEYDIESAGFNICKQFELLTEEKIKELEEMDKKERHIALGYIQKGNKEFINKLNEGFKKCREWFFKNNNIQDDDVISIRKDAIFVRKRRCKETSFGCIKFNIKHEYNSFIILNSFEFYIGDEYISCKGISDKSLSYHEEYMMNFIKEFMYLFNKSKNEALDFIKTFAVAYRNYELDVNYYREFNHESLFRPKKDIKVNISDMGFINYNLDSKYLDISYNYINYIIPLYRMII